MAGNGSCRWVLNPGSRASPRPVLRRSLSLTRRVPSQTGTALCPSVCLSVLVECLLCSLYTCHQVGTQQFPNTLLLSLLCVMRLNLGSRFTSVALQEIRFVGDWFG